MRTTIAKRKPNKTRICLLSCLTVGVVAGRFVSKWISTQAWQTITAMITAAMQSEQPVVKSYLTAFSVCIFIELLLFILCLSLAAVPVIHLFFICSGIGIGSALTAYFAVFEGNGLLFGFLVLEPYMAALVCTCILEAEMMLKLTHKVIHGTKNENSLILSEKTGYQIAVKLFIFTAFLAVFSLYFAIMKHYFAPVLSY